MIFKFGELKNVKEVQRAFRLEFCPKNPRSVPNYMAFKRLLDRFEASGGHTRPASPQGPEPTKQEDITLVKEFFMNHKQAHLREASRELELSVGQIWKILRHELKWKSVMF